MNIYEKELARLKPYDPIQGSHEVNNHQFITTAGHGYLVVPNAHPHYDKAEAIIEYGFRGDHALYLEEDVEAPSFMEYL